MNNGFYLWFLFLLIAMTIINLFLNSLIISQAVILYFIYLIAVTFHELGHLFWGKFIGMTFKKIFFGPIKITRKENVLKVSINKIFLFSNGQCYMFFDVENIKKSISLYYLGGVISNLFVCCICFIVNLHNNFSFIGYLGLFNFVITIATILPFDGNDGYSAFKVISGDYDVNNRVWLQNLYISNKKISEISSVEFDRLLSIFKLSNSTNDIFSSGILISLYYLEQKEIYRLQDHLESILVHLNSKVNLNVLKEVKTYIEAVEFLINLLSCKEKELPKKYKGGKRKLIEDTRYLKKNAEDDRIIEYICHVLAFHDMVLE